MKYSDTETIKIKDFFNACNEMIKGRFILSDIKVAKILKSIANSEALYSLMAKVLSNFKFKEELEAAKTSSKVNGGYFVLPTEEDKIVALVFCILLEVDKQKLNLQSFVNEHFYSAEGYNISYNNFAINVLSPFKNAVLSLLNCDEDGNCLSGEDEEEEDEVQPEVIKKPDAKQKLLFANLKMSLNELLSVILRSKIKKETKEELSIIINALNEAILLEKLNIINALIIPLEYMIGKNKEVKLYYNDFKENLVAFYFG